MPVPASVPLIVALPTVSVNAPMLSVAPVATVTAALSASRSFDPSDSVPPLTFTTVAPAVPLSADVPPTCVSVPVPRLALIVAPLSE